VEVLKKENQQKKKKNPPKRKKKKKKKKTPLLKTSILVEKLDQPRIERVLRISRRNSSPLSKYYYSNTQLAYIYLRLKSFSRNFYNSFDLFMLTLAVATQ